MQLKLELDASNMYIGGLSRVSATHFLLVVFVCALPSIKNSSRHFCLWSKSVLCFSLLYLLPSLGHTETPLALLHPCSCPLASTLSLQAEETCNLERSKRLPSLFFASRFSLVVVGEWTTSSRSFRAARATLAPSAAPQRLP